MSSDDVISVEESAEDSKRGKLYVALKDYLYSVCRNPKFYDWVSVRDVSLTTLSLNAKIPVNFRSSLLLALEQKGYLLRQGFAAFMQYKFQDLGEDDVPALAKELWDKLVLEVRSSKESNVAKSVDNPVDSKQLPRRRKLSKNSNLQSNSHKRFYSILDKVYFINNSAITEGTIIAVKAEKLNSSIDGVSVQDPSNITALYLVELSNFTEVNVSHGSVYPSVDLLLEGLRVKYNLTSNK